MKKKVKRIIKKVLLIDFIRQKRIEREIKCRLKNKSENRIIIMNTPEHGNLGDQAIICAEKKFLEKNMPSYDVLEITHELIKKNIQLIKNKSKSSEIICIHGGGNIGSIWELEHNNVLRIISEFKENKIIVFPQTAYFSADERGRTMWIEFKRRCEACDDLTLCARDFETYKIFNKIDVNVLFVPDIVLYLDKLDYNTKRSGCLLCLRSDKEKVRGDDFETKLIDRLNELEISYSYTDTVIKETVIKSIRDVKLNEKWKEFASSKLVITDRLHGMIFAAITGTPCIAVDNVSKKVSGVYKWIEHLDYITVCKDNTEVLGRIDEFYAKEECMYVCNNNFFEGIKVSFDNESRKNEL